MWGDVDTRGLVVTPFGEDELVVVVPRNHPLARHQAVRFADTLSFDYVMFEPASPLYLWLRREAARLNAVLRGRIQVRGFDALCRMVEARLGIGVAPRRAAEGFAKSMQIGLVQLREPWAQRQFCIVYRSAAELTPIEKSFLTFAESRWPGVARRRRRRAGHSK